MLHVSAKHRKIGLPLREDIANLVPHETLTVDGNEFMVLDHSADVTRLCRNMGIDVPAPILSQYNFPGRKPFDVQKQTTAMLTTEPRAFVLNGMGTGKTASAIWAWHHLHMRGEAKRILVVAPLSTLRFTWQREFFDLIPGFETCVLHGTRDKRLKLLESDARVFIVNHDGLAIIADALPKDIDTLVLDELSVYRNGTAKRTKVAKAVAAKMKWVWGMTGSPVPNEPTDAWAQCSIINPVRVPKFFGRFRDSVMTKLTQFKWIAKEGALDVVYNAMQPAVRYTLSDVVELPDLVERTVDVEMGTKQAKLYDAMEKKAHALIDTREVTAMNAGVVMNKLLQIACGYVYTNDRDIISLDNNSRIEAVLDIVRSTNEKVLIFVPFKHALTGISKALEGDGIEHAVISGDVPSAERNRIFHLFQNTNKYKVIAAHPATMSHGLTLTAASTILWFAPTLSLETFEQANARITRVGQKAKQQVIMLQATKVEKRIYRVLRQKQSVQNQLLGMFEGEE